MCRCCVCFLQRVRIAHSADRCNIQGLSVRPAVCPSVTFACFVQINEDTIVRSSASGRTIILVSCEIKFIRVFAGDHPAAGPGISVRGRGPFPTLPFPPLMSRPLSSPPLSSPPLFFYPLLPLPLRSRAPLN